MIQGFTPTLLVRLPFAYFMSIQENASLVKIGFSAPMASIFAIIINFIFYLRNKKYYIFLDKQFNKKNTKVHKNTKKFN